MPRDPYNPFAGFPIRRVRPAGRSALTATVTPPEAWSEPTTPLTEAWSEFRAWPFFADWILRGSSPNINTSPGNQAWFKFGQLNIGEAFGQAVTLHSVGVNLGSTDPTTSLTRVAGSNAAWGDPSGQGACVVLGVNMGGTLGQWEERPPPPVASIQTTYTLSASRFGTERPGRVLHYPFPPGTNDNLFGTNTQRAALLASTTPLAWALSAEDTVDVFFVMLAANFNAAGPNQGFGCLIQGSALFALTYGTQPRAT
jgi:hypothetical protein